MARLRPLLFLALVTGSSTAAIVACGDDPSTPAAAVADAAPVADAGETGEADAEPATAQALAVYPGMVAKLEATVDASSTFVWTMVAVPGTSDLGTASLVDATPRRPRSCRTGSVITRSPSTSRPEASSPRRSTPSMRSTLRS